jgi:hypothetical protein
MRLNLRGLGKWQLALIAALQDIERAQGPGFFRISDISFQLARESNQSALFADLSVVNNASPTTCKRSQPSPATMKVSES